MKRNWSIKMKHITLVLFILAMSLTACAAPATPEAMPEEVTSVDSSMPVPSAAVTEMVVQGKLPAPSFESQVYLNEAVSFVLDYPAQWTVIETMAGERSSQALLLSSPEIADLAVVPEGETRVAVTVQQWDPKNDLAAFVDVRKTAWESSGFTILDEEPLTLDLGLSAVRFTVQTPEGLTSQIMFAAIGEQYVSISGEGDLALVQEIMRYLRPIGN
jgi:hypothetical protein